MKVSHADGGVHLPDDRIHEHHKLYEEILIEDGGLDKLQELTVSMRLELK
jgi:hypothetical protein